MLKAPKLVALCGILHGHRFYSISFMFLTLYERIAQLFIKMHLRLTDSLGEGLDMLRLATAKPFSTPEVCLDSRVTTLR